MLDETLPNAVRHAAAPPADPADARRRVLTGIKATGTPHLGNLAGAIRPGLELAAAPETDALFFIADYHALTAHIDADVLRQSVRAVAAAWMACGLDPAFTPMFRQSAVPEVMELSWILSCACPKGFMNRAHAYKAAVASNRGKGAKDDDRGINMGLFGYPILMSADILAHGTNLVPVGRDQVQHIEFARDLAQRFNQRHGDVFTLPVASIRDDTVLPGLDGRKMSKSYGNTIPLFAPPDALRALVARIKTDARRPGEPKEPNASTVFQIYAAFATATETESMRLRFHGGISWADAKSELTALLLKTLEEPRRRYVELSADTALLDRVLADGADQARSTARHTLDAARQAIGLDRTLAKRG